VRPAEKTGSATNTDRLVQLGRQAVDPPGQSRQDLWIVQDIVQRLGLPWNYRDVREALDEMRRSVPSIAGITRERLERDGAVVDPGPDEGGLDEKGVFHDRFPAADGRARFVPADSVAADERPDADAPLVLIIGRQLEHWHTGSMTRRAGVLDAIEPDPVVSLHPLDLEAAGIRQGDVVTLRSRRGGALGPCRRRHGTRGSVRVLLLLRGGGEPAHESGARPVRQDPRAEVLRREARTRRHRGRDARLRRRPAARHCVPPG
jgi:formate dehydrogenase major subunit